MEEWHVQADAGEIAAGWLSGRNSAETPGALPGEAARESKVQQQQLPQPQQPMHQEQDTRDEFSSYFLEVEEDANKRDDEAKTREDAEVGPSDEVRRRPRQTLLR